MTTERREHAAQFVAFDHLICANLKELRYGV